ncbi:unnamed protein product, partial [Prorocentrum cordatum]
VISLCLAIYRKDGIIVSTERGLTFLLVAEVIHFAAHSLVCGVVQHVASGCPSSDGEVDERAVRAEPLAEARRCSRPLVCCAVSPKKHQSGLQRLTPQSLSSPFNWPQPSSPPAAVSPHFPRSPGNFNKA